MPQISTSPQALPTLMPILAVISLAHFINDVTQALLQASFPVLKSEFLLSFSQLGLLTLVYQMTACIFQPAIGWFTDKNPKPYSLPVGMIFSFTGMMILGFATNYPMLLTGAAILGLGSSIFHPEASRLARLASGGRHGFAQSLFQVGGSFGSALGPLVAAFLILPYGQRQLSVLAGGAFIGILLLTGLGRWYQRNGATLRGQRRTKAAERALTLSRGRVIGAVLVLLALLLSKYFYTAAFTGYYNFYLIDRFGLSAQTAQICQFLFFAAVAAGTMIGGPVGDRIGRRRVIWGSILGVLPFTLVLPYASLGLTIALSILIGLILASAFSAILAYAQDLIPGRVGMVSGLIFGFAFGIAGIGAAALGALADWTSITFVFQVCAFLPTMGLLTVFLPDIERDRA